METTTPTQSYRNNRKPGAVAALPPEIAGRLVPRAVEIEAAVLGGAYARERCFLAGVPTCLSRKASMSRAMP